MSHCNYDTRFFFFFWYQPYTSCQSCTVWISWVIFHSATLLQTFALTSQPQNPVTRQADQTQGDKTFFLKFEMRNAHLMLTKGGDKIKIKINKHKEDECSVWRGVVVKKKNWAIKNNLFPDGSWKLTYVYQNKNKNSITNNYLFVVNVFRIFVARNVFLVFLAVQTVIDRILLTIYWIDFQRCLSFINWAFHL